MTDAPKKRKSVLRYILVGCGALAALVLLLVIGLAVWLFAGSGSPDDPHHPFRSAMAKARYLAVYDSIAREWPVPSDTVTVRTSYGPTFVRVSGPDSAPPLVLLHGAGGSSLQWQPNVAALAKHYRTYAIDNIYDNGRSVYTRKPETAADFVAWLGDSFDALELGDEINLLGLSYGGWVASQYAVSVPERLNKVVLIAPAGTVRPLSFEWIRRAVLCALPQRRFTRNFLYWLLEDLAREGDASRALLDREIDAAYLAIRSYKFKQLVNPSVLSDGQLQGLSVPTLFLVGENEKIYPAHQAVERLNTVAPQIETEIVPDAGHDLTIVQAELVNERVLEFLRH